ncbi:hypothetical protein SBRCBS47491_006728 [Sporothrix bragantina]|uniref:Major facilitator superfamily (MFS) profile domain-containing protein n=1 Tax=Sporothrix bragantina TaxID=671064 RepID=A0ABP0C7D7_9PEZI
MASNETMDEKEARVDASPVIVVNLADVIPVNPKPWYRTKHLALLNLLLIIPLLSAATIGFDGALMNSLQALTPWKTYFNHPNSSILGTINAIFSVGKILGIGPAAWMVDRYGRKRPIWIGLVCLVCATILQGAAQNTAMFIVSRLLLGIFTAFIAQASPILVAELAFPTHRGKATALYQTSFYIGSIYASWSAYGTSRLTTDWAWRIPSILQGTLPLIQFAFLYFVPESPRWLIAQGRHNEAHDLLMKWHGGGRSDDEETVAFIDHEMRQIDESVVAEQHAMRTTGYIDLLRSPGNRRRTAIAAIVGFFAQWNGVGVVSYYLTLVLNTVGITKATDQTLINGCLQIFNWLSAILAGALMIDRLGRRTLFLVSVGGMFFSYIAWTVLSALFTTDKVRYHDLAPGVVAFIFICYFFYDIAWAPLLLAYPVEIFPYALRSRGVAVTYGSTFTGLIISQFVNPIAMSHLGWKYYCVFLAILFCLFWTIYFLFPETRGHSLEEIAEIFDGSTNGSATGHSSGQKVELSQVEKV